MIKQPTSDTKIILNLDISFNSILILTLEGEPVAPFDELRPEEIRLPVWREQCRLNKGSVVKFAGEGRYSLHLPRFCGREPEDEISLLLKFFSCSLLKKNRN